MSFSEVAKRLLVGRKLASAEMGHTLLPKRIALPVFASDALSSVAYAPDEILVTLSLAGAAAFVFSLPIGIMVAVVMLVVVASYRQTVHAYPSGGGDYEVVTTNLGGRAGMVVASALLVDYVLTVAVSVSSGVQNAKAILPAIAGHEGLVAARAIFVLMAINLRGTKESGTIFAIPTYAFMLGVISMVLWGVAQIVVLGRTLVAETSDMTLVSTSNYLDATGPMMAFLLARTFSSGCAALTGVEAISNGVPNFRPPKSRNAATTLALLGGLAVSMLLGIIALARVTGIQMVEAKGSYLVAPDGSIHHEAPTVMSQLSRAVFYDSGRPMFYFMMVVTVLILFLAANTAFNGFPTLASILAKDGYLPRQLHARGDRLAFSNGILILAAAAIALVLVFDASVTALIQLYVVGVFVSFTLSQAGMIRHWSRHLKSEKDIPTRRQMQRSRLINTVGVILTGVVLVVVLVSKFTHGAYLSILAMGAVFVVMQSIRRHYDLVHREVALAKASDRALPSRVRAIVLVNSINKPVLKALRYAQATRPSTLEAVTVAVDPQETDALVEAWDAEQLDVSLKVIASPYREVTNPVLDYVASLRTENPRNVICVYIPEYVVGHWWEQPLHNQTAAAIRRRLHYMSGVMVTLVPYHLASSAYLRADEAEAAAAYAAAKEAHARTNR